MNSKKVPGLEVRLQKFLADAGVASRRECESLIEAGRVKVNGQTVRILGTKVNPENVQVELDGELITVKKTKTYIAFHKPRGILSTMSDPEGRPSLSDLEAVQSKRLFHVGRLDKESEGLILLTDDGEWANRVSHPSNGVTKVYQLFVAERITPEILKRIRGGVKLRDGLVRVERAALIPGGVELEIHEGRNQIIRRMATELGLTVLRLVRTEIGSIKIGQLPVGKTRNLSTVEVTSM